MQHFRNFQSELKGAAKTLGFHELNPTNTAKDLLGSLEEGSKVAITTRLNNAVTQEYVAALEARGLEVRVVSGQSAVQDFCFLKRAKKELVGLQLSSFFHWAAYLGFSKRVLSYSVEDTKQLATSQKQPGYYHWNDTEMRKRFVYRTYEV